MSSQDRTLRLLLLLLGWLVLWRDMPVIFRSVLWSRVEEQISFAKQAC